MFAKVLVEYTNKAVDKTFIYEVPEFLKNKLKVGMKVKIPFNNRLINGFIEEIIGYNDTKFRPLMIDSVVDEYLVLDEELRNLAKYLQEKTLCSKIIAYQTMLPSSLKIKNQKHNYAKYDTYVCLNENVDIYEFIKNNSKKTKQIEIINKLIDEKLVLKSEITGTCLKKLIEENIVITKKVQKYRININNNKLTDEFLLTEEQSQCFKQVDITKHDTYLLYGVTGSGKTEVYLQLIKKVLNFGKTALMLVPEISLTTQMIQRIYERFSNDVAIFHSGLSDGEKYDEYLKIYRNEIKVVVGTRSAIFTPLKNIGLIILDEEHSETFKQDTNPRYSAIDMAIYRAKYHNCPVILGSATPSLEAMARAKKGVYKLLTMKKRVGKALLPTIELVNMQEEMKKKNPIISSKLDFLIKDRLGKKEQIILLLNRRGYSTIITCQNCGYVYKCPHCDISLTYHKNVNELRCHYCGYTKYLEGFCPECHERALNYMGLGTEKLEQTIQEKYPQSKIIRMDVDTTQNKGAHERIINQFKNHEYDILLGTQMISKGLDFPLVTLVGVINGDASLNIPDFRSGEKTYALLNQVSGRAGRSGLKGEVIIQTFNPDNPYLNFVKTNNYENFYEYEMKFRKLLRYPPYYYLINVMIMGKDLKSVEIEANKVFKFLNKEKEKETLLYGPNPASMLKINNVYRYQIMVKYRFDKTIMESLKHLDELYANNRNIKFEIDVNPVRM